MFCLSFVQKAYRCGRTFYSLAAARTKYQALLFESSRSSVGPRGVCLVAEKHFANH